MKVSIQNHFKKWRPFLDFTSLGASAYFFRYTSTPNLKKKNSSEKWVFIHRFLEESKVKNLYRHLHGVYRVSKGSLKSMQEQKIISSVLHPLEEQSWYIQYLKGQLLSFTPEEIWTLILNLEQRDKYIRYLDSDDDWESFEIFLQNYLIHSLSIDQLEPVFYFAYRQQVERTALLEKLFQCLLCDQAYDLFARIKASKKEPNHWLQCCRDCIDTMRNSQVKKIISLIPYEVESYALKKLYPCEILEVIEDELDEKRKMQLAQHVLKGYKEWWQSFSYEEVKETHQTLLDLLQ